MNTVMSNTESTWILLHLFVNMFYEIVSTEIFAIPLLLPHLLMIITLTLVVIKGTLLPHVALSVRERSRAAEMRTHILLPLP